MHDRQSHVTPPRRALMESIQDENGPPDREDSDDDEEAEEDEDSEDEDSEESLRMRTVRMTTMMMLMTMIPNMRELKIRVKKRNYPVCNRLFSISENQC